MEFLHENDLHARRIPDYREPMPEFYDQGAHFRIPFNENEALPDTDEKVCIVSIIGKTSLSQSRFKINALSTVIGSDVFQDFESLPLGKVGLQGYHDVRRRVIYLLLDSLQDSALLVHHITSDHNNQDFHSLFQELDHEFTKCLLFLFSVSHIVLLSLPRTNFDVSYVRLFRVLDQIRVKMQPSLSEVLKPLSVSKDWILAGRPCAPRVLFSVNAGQNTPSKSRKSIQHGLEDQIYRILRKSRVITNISNNSLFAIPANQEFVYVGCPENQVDDSVSFLMDQLRNGCISTREAGGSVHSYQTMRRSHQFSAVQAPDSSSATKASDSSLAGFLNKHSELALGKGFDDNVGRTHVQAVFECPSATVWYEVCSRVYHFIMEGESKPGLNSLSSLTDIDTRFSESRCQKVLPVAENAYQEGLPQFYTRQYHEEKLSSARRVFVQHARGPACDKYLHELDSLCTRLWENGRRQCEAISMTGLPCVHQLHHTSEIVEADSAVLPVMAHSSQVKTKSSCNCGRKQSERADPFSHQEANHLFYQRLAETCCSKLESIQLPVFTPSTQHVKPGSVQAVNVIPPSLSLHNKSPPRSPRSHARKDSFGQKQEPLSNLSLALSLGQSGSSQQVYSGADQSGAEHSGEPRPPQDDSQSQGEEEEGEESEKEDERPPSPVSSALKTVVVEREHSTIEYLSGMIHSQCPLRLLPKFPSWAITVLARYTSYSHQHGLDQAGFLHGSNFLLPWDISLKVDRERWPSIAETKRNKTKKGHKDGGELNFKVFVGLEYECQRGHRFFMSAPDRIIRANSGSGVKESANRLLSGDMPLYTACQCRATKTPDYMAQLMRIYVAAPEGPVHVTVNPRVRPGPAPCPLFYPGNDTPISLPPGMVSVVRLPYVYVGDGDPYYMPDDPQQLLECRLVKGTFGYIESER